MSLTDNDEYKCLKIVSNPTHTSKITNQVVAQIKDNQLYVIPELSDATAEEIISYNQALHNIAQTGSISSIICDLDDTSILVINGTNLKTNERDTIIHLCTAGARTEKMKELETQSAMKLERPDADYENKCVDILEKLIQMIPSGQIESIIRQYCWKFGTVHFFAYAEKVFVEEILLHGQKIYD